MFQVKATDMDDQKKVKRFFQGVSALLLGILASYLFGGAVWRAWITLNAIVVEKVGLVGMAFVVLPILCVVSVGIVFGITVAYIAPNQNKIQIVTAAFVAFHFFLPYARIEGFFFWFMLFPIAFAVALYCAGVYEGQRLAERWASKRTEQLT